MDTSTREEVILYETAQLLLKIPFDDVTMTAVSAKTGMSKRTLYQYFSSREDLLVRAVAKLSQSIFIPLSSKDSKLPLSKRLSILMRVNTPPGCEGNKLECLRSIVAKAHSYPTLAQNLYSNGYGALLGFVRAEITRAIEDNEIKLPLADVELAAEMLMGMVFENTLARLLHPFAQPLPDAERDRRRECAIDIFLRAHAP
jgi:AcrR family transcriptional regulator